MFRAGISRSLRVSRPAAIGLSIATSSATLIAWTTITTGSSCKARTLCAAATAGGNAVAQPLVLYQYKICPYCNRVKAYLDFLKIKYETVEVNPLTKAELAFTKGAKKVPILRMNDEIISESSIIISRITAQLQSTAATAAVAVPNAAFFPADTDYWSEWSEKTLAVMLYPNITRSLQECWECFSYAENVSEWSSLQRSMVRVVSPPFMYLANGKIKRKYGIQDERKELQVVVLQWCDALGENKFLHGDNISMPDVQVFGVLKSIQGQRTFNEIMQQNAVLKTWYDNMQLSLTSR